MGELTKGGKRISCANCNGSGIGQHASSYQPWHEECPECGGSGLNWQYPGGAIAKFYSGPLIGRQALRPTTSSEER